MYESVSIFREENRSENQGTEADWLFPIPLDNYEQNIYTVQKFCCPVQKSPWFTKIIRRRGYYEKYMDTHHFQFPVYCVNSIIHKTE